VGGAWKPGGEGTYRALLGSDSALFLALGCGCIGSGCFIFVLIYFMLFSNYVL
jgi:hypothetical protein